MRPIQDLKAEEIRDVRYILHDIDDTITNSGKLLPESYAGRFHGRDLPSFR